MSIKAFRGGASNRKWSSDPGAVTIHSRHGRMWLGFTMPAAGRGVTVVRIEISPEDFDELVRVMIKTNEAAALQAIATALQGRDVIIKAGRDVAIQVGAAS
jgi:putative NADH-flavin reductase